VDLGQEMPFLIALDFLFQSYSQIPHLSRQIAASTSVS
jgi:hypothetical protein